MKRMFSVSLLLLCCFCWGFPTVAGDIAERIETRSFPAVFSAWAAWFVNRQEIPYVERTAHFDLWWSPVFGGSFRFERYASGEVELVGDLAEAHRQRDEYLELNPNLLFILEIHMRAVDPGSPFLKGLYDEADFPWIKADDGSLVLGTPAERYVDILIDFTHPVAQDAIVRQTVAAAKSGLYDGIFLDFWNERGVILEGYRTNEAEQAARENILQRIRAGVDDDFLIIVNNTGTLLRGTPYVNGLFMETYPEYADNYSHQGMIKLENVLLWAEEHLREPRVNCLQVEGLGGHTLPLSPESRQRMRCVTTLICTHSNGFINYTMGVGWRQPHSHDDFYWNYIDDNVHYWTTHKNQHDTWPHSHAGGYWHDFWDAELGQSVSEKAQQYKNIQGLFIREFTNGWAVYNRSGTEQTLTLPVMATGVESNHRDTTHTVPDLDGEIFLKTPVVTADVNGDGVVNILDLVVIAGALGNPDGPDLNGDGVVNILDLVVIAKEISK